MSAVVKCKACKTENKKGQMLCRACGKSLYRDVSFKVAMLVTLICDLIFAFVYLWGIVLFIQNTGSDVFTPFIRSLPIQGSLSYYFVIALFAMFAISKIAFVLNVYFFKRTLPVSVRRATMFVEAIFLFPLQLVLAIYFYNVATRPNWRDSDN